MMKKKLYLNTTLSLIYQVIAVLIGLILPRLILQKYGSEINGLVTSITQMLSVITMLDLGVGAVVQAALYSPLAKNDIHGISIIYSSAKKYFGVIVKILLLYIIILCCYYSFFKSSSFEPIFSISLILAISISYFAQYYFGICNLLLLNADQKIYIGTIASIIAIVLNAFCTVFLIRIDASIQLVKLVSSVVFLGKPLFLQYYVKNNYRIERISDLPDNALPNKWSGLAQHVTSTVTVSIDNVVLTLFSTFQLLSVYNIYIMPLNAIKNLMDVTSTSYKSYFGRLIVQEDRDVLISEFSKYETIMHYFISIIFCTTINVLVPFVLVYTNGVADINYNYPLFGCLITLAYTIYSLRLPYSNLIFAAGKFKETQKYSVVECILNIVISVALVFKLGLIGVAIGTCISSGYRTIASALYLKRDVIFRNIRYFALHITVDFISVLVVYGIWNLVNLRINGFSSWLLGAGICCCISIVVNTFMNLLIFKFFRDSVRNLLHRK